MVKEIKYTGFTATPSDYICPDGELDTAVNLIPEDGELHPIYPGKVTGSNSENRDTILGIFLHKAGNYNHLIVAKGLYDSAKDDIITCRLYHYDSLNSNIDNTSDVPDGAIDNSEPIEDGVRYVEFLVQKNGTVNMGALGDVIVFTGATDEKMRYLFWHESKYNYLGTHLPEVYLSFGLQGGELIQNVDDAITFSGTVNMYWPYDEASAADWELENLPVHHIEFENNPSSDVQNAILSKLDDHIQECSRNNLFCFPFFVRYALKMSGGTLIMHSAPILMTPSTPMEPPIIEYVSYQPNNEYNYEDSYYESLHLWNRKYGGKNQTLGLKYHLNGFWLNYKFLDGISDNISKWNGLIDSVEIYVSQQIPTYYTNNRVISFWNTNAGTNTYIGAKQGDVLNLGDLNPIPTASPSDSEHKEHTEVYGDSTIAKGIEITPEKFRQNLESIENYYLVASIPIGELSTTRKPVPMQEYEEGVHESALTNLLSKGMVSSDSSNTGFRQHDILMPKAVKEYNSRLNISGVRRELYGGFPLSSMLACCTDTITPLNTNDTYTTEVFIKKNGIEYSVVCDLDRGKQNLAMSSILKGNGVKSSWPNYFFYPDNDAYKMRIYHNGINNYAYSGNYYEVALKQHTFLNGAFAFIDYDSVKSMAGNATIPEPLPAVINELSKVYTTETANAFVFRTTTISQIGTDDIIATATVSKALSQGQFGQFPMYAFTKGGVWAVTYTDEGSPEKVQPVTRDVLLNPESIMEIDNAVLFAADRGIMLLSGADSICISDTICSDTTFTADDVLPHIDKVTSKANRIDIVPFRQFLPECRMLYDYTHQHIVVYNPSFNYAYVYSLKSKQWGMMQSNIASSINSYPNCMYVDRNGNIIDLSAIDAAEVVAETEEAQNEVVYYNNDARVIQSLAESLDIDPAEIDSELTNSLVTWVNILEHDSAYGRKLNTEIYSALHVLLEKLDSILELTENSDADFMAAYYRLSALAAEEEQEAEEETETQEQSTNRTCFLITRPLKLDAPDVLKTVDTVIQRGNFRKGHIKTILYGSRDLYSWHLIASSRDHILRGFRGTPYKYFRIVLICDLEKDESIAGCTIGFTPRLTTKLR